MAYQQDLLNERLGMRQTAQKRQAYGAERPEFFQSPSRSQSFAPPLNITPQQRSAMAGFADRFGGTPSNINLPGGGMTNGYVGPVKPQPQFAPIPNTNEPRPQGSQVQDQSDYTRRFMEERFPTSDFTPVPGGGAASLLELLSGINRNPQGNEMGSFLMALLGNRF